MGTYNGKPDQKVSGPNLFFGFCLPCYLIELLGLKLSYPNNYEHEYENMKI